MGAGDDRSRRPVDGLGGEGIGLSVAARHPGASMNDLTDPAEIDPLSGNAVLSGVPVTVAPAAGGGRRC